VPPAHISASIQNLCKMCRYVYINELSGSDQLDPNFWMSQHDYRSLFQQFDLICLQTEQIGPQTYYLFGRISSSDVPSGVQPR
jgi:hypothetical protein